MFDLKTILSLILKEYNQSKKVLLYLRWIIKVRQIAQNLVEIVAQTPDTRTRFMTYLGDKFLH